MHQSTSEIVANRDLTEITALVTGAAGGLGAETARALASAGATVILASRDILATGAQAEAIRSETANPAVFALALDLTDFKSIERCADEVMDRFPGLNRLINNAGVMATPLARTAAGCEMQFGTNHIGHFLLTGLLLPLLGQNAPARIINLSSGGHKHAPVDFDDLHWEKREYNKWQAYGQAKTANVLFTVELDRRLREKGVRAFAVHPGAIATHLGRHLTQEDIHLLLSESSSRGKLQFKDVSHGAATSVWAAISADLDGMGGLYLEDCSIAQEVPVGEAEHGYFAWAMDPQAARRLWSESEAIVGRHFAG